MSEIEKLRTLEGAIVDLVSAIQKGDTTLSDEIDAVGEAVHKYPEWRVEIHPLEVSHNKMGIEILLNTFARQEGPYQDRLDVEELEDAITDLLLERGFKDFTIEDSYTGNSIRKLPPTIEEGDVKRLQPELERQAEQAFTEQEELDAIERPASQAQVEADESGEDIYECEHCNAEFRESEILRRDFGGETGGITFCPRCKEATKLICVTEVDK